MGAPIWDRLDLYKLIVESARDFAIFTIDRENRITTWNRGAQRILSFTAREAIGMSGAKIFIPEDRTRKAPEREMAMARDQGRAEDERWHLRKDGTRFWGSGLMMPLLDERKRLVGYLKILRDLTERKEAQDALVELNRTLEERVAQRTADLEKSHTELRKLAVQLTRTERLERQRIAADIHDNLGQMLALAQIQVSRISSCLGASDEISQAARELRDYLDEAIQYTRGALATLSPVGLRSGNLVDALKSLIGDMGRHGLKVSVVHDRKKLLINPDLNAVLFPAVRELLYNVRKHAGVAAAIVRLSRQKDFVRIEVMDKGAGFGKGKQTEDSDKTSGFGLFQQAERLRLFGGKLEVDRQRKRGARIIVTAPISSA